MVRLKIILHVLYSTFNNTIHFHVWTHVSDLTGRIAGYDRVDLGLCHVKHAHHVLQVSPSIGGPVVKTVHNTRISFLPTNATQRKGPFHTIYSVGSLILLLGFKPYAR